jgi:2-oxoglutarate dehydrogenase E2 component (dihydrolipoamide succinyltransferase)
VTPLPSGRVEVLLPDLGEGVTDAFIVQWYAELGSVVAELAPLAEVMTDKANVEVPSPVGGRVVDLRYAADERVDVGAVIAVIDTTA